MIVRILSAFASYLCVAALSARQRYQVRKAPWDQRAAELQHAPASLAFAGR